MDGTGREDHSSDTTAGGDDAAPLVESTLELRWSAPELALLLADRAAAAGTTGQRAALIAATSLNRLGREVEAGRRALAGLRHLDHVDPGGSGSDLDRPLRVELAAAAVGVGAANTALGVLRPVLAAGPGTGPALRASALVQLGAVLARLGPADAAARALREADDLYQGDPDVGPDPAVLLRGTVRVARSAQHRRHGELAAAESAAREGLDLLSELSDPVLDGGAVRGRLTLELVLALLDRGELDAAVRAASVLEGSVRAAAAPARGWLQLALATRVHLPAGRHSEAQDLLGDAVASARRHSLDPVLAECLEGLCRVHEERGEYVEALGCLRSAHAAAYRHRRAADALRIELIEEYGTPGRDVAGLADHLVGLIGTGRVRRRRSDAPGLLDLPGFLGRAEVVLAGAHPGRVISLAVVTVDRLHSIAACSAGGESVLARIAEQLRDAAPARGVLGRLDYGRFAVLLPGAGRAAALDWTQRLRATVAATDWSESTEDRSVTISAGVAEDDSGIGVDELLRAADRALADARSHRHDHAATDHAGVSEPVAAADVTAVLDPPVPLVAPGDASQVGGLESVDQDPESGAEAGRARHRRDGSRQLPVAELLSAAGSTTSRASPGRRRAEDRPETSEHGSGLSTPSTLVSEPPLGSRELGDDPSPDDRNGAERGWSLPEDVRSGTATPATIRSLDSTIPTDRIGEVSREIGLGDLLAEALAAFDEGRRSRGIGAVEDQLTEPILPAVGSGSSTGSDLGMPDRTEEQVQQLPGTRRHSAAGD